MKLKFLKKNILIAFHPETLDSNSSEKQIIIILEALSLLKNTNLIFTGPNSDTNNKIIYKKMIEFVSKNKNAYFFNSLGQLKFLSCLKYVDAIIGNSSSGLLEAPSFKIGTINIGDRQKGRIEASSVINSNYDSLEIKNNIAKLYSEKFQKRLNDVKNPYGNGGASLKIYEKLKNFKYLKI